MIHIKKDFSNIPKSLYVPESEDDPKADNESKETHRIRLEVINEKSYKNVQIRIGKEKVDYRYKQDDVKKTLSSIYNNKCAFCEQKIIDNNTVEHFRPKSEYYWLAFSWDNLMLTCSECNGKKNNSFDCQKSKVTFNENDKKKIDNSIHQLSKGYNETEEQFFIHPEYENPEPQFTFDKDGVIYHKNDRAKYTIEKCTINRPKLNEARKRELDNFEKEINLLVKFTKNKDVQNPDETSHLFWK